MDQQYPRVAKIHVLDTVPTNDPNITTTTSGNAGTKSRRTVTFTTEDMQRKKNNVKARTTLLLSLPDKHQLRFSKYKTARELWDAILKTFGGQLQFMDVEVEQDDLNKKFLTSLAPEWLMHTIVWRNRSDLDTMSLDDMYNHLKIDEDDMEEMDIKWSMALLRFDKSKVECFNCHKMGHFARECRAPKSQERGRKDNYRQESKVDEQTPKELMAIDGVGWDWSYMANEGEDHALVSDEEAPKEFALMANTSTESKVFDNSLCSRDCKKNNDSLNSKITDLTDKLFDANNFIYHYKLALAQVEYRLVEYKEREVKYIEKIKTLEFYRESNKECIKTLSKKLETLKLEKDRVAGKLAGLLTASKDLDNLIKSQRKRVKRGTSRSQNIAFKSPSHRPVSHRPYGPPYKFLLPVKVVATTRRLEMPLPEVYTAIEEKKKKLPVKDRWQLH
nr:hypothetical protein [Tanacetum cinerariifolium]